MSLQEPISLGGWGVRSLTKRVETLLSTVNKEEYDINKTIQRLLINKK